MRLSAGFFTLYLAIQIALPAVQIFRNDSAFRWGMFAGSPERYEIFAEYADGARESLDQIRKRTGRAKLLRTEFDPKKLLYSYLCSGTPRPQAILFRNLRSGTEERYGCR